MGGKPEYEKYMDQAQRERAFEEAVGRLRMGMFVALLGPLAVGVVILTKFSVAEYPWLRYVILGTAPLGFLIAIIQYLRVPGAGKASGKAIRILVSTLVLAGATFALAGHFSLL